ncbi:hypothetical protein W97_09151 [Coniosporium apollinis CBS 100218]|uniref:CFEM domain-containing protein n=1 Tax=Coniosporium apollinis (strain CBS 100218) TaxID=1168221 RepID=R7Z6U2_CONA1|nr:uncharacterized protein W97_09151 [Coniosporium apollinis CBS 100218]EON69887.1 hypothetical protein W97_09151 [Coniosporium apollinis CBS 100218]
MNLNLLLFTFVAYCVTLGAAHGGDIPVCADACFSAGITLSGCAFDDLVCQCTAKNDFISSYVTTCLFTTHPCSTTDLAQVQGAAHRLCASALANASLINSWPVATATSTPSATANSTGANITSTAQSSASATYSHKHSATSSPTAAPSNDAVSGSLSTGAKAGIGVGAGSLALSAALLFYLRWRRRRRPKHAYSLGDSDSTEQVTTRPSSAPPELKLLELGAFEKPLEFEALERPVELEARERPLELRDTSRIAELPG